MEWVLIMVLWIKGSAIHSVSFNSEVACESASQTFNQEMGSGFGGRIGVAFCTPKGPESEQNE